MRIRIRVRLRVQWKTIYNVIFVCRQNVAEEDFQLGEVQAPLDGTPLENACDQFPFCPREASRYRTVDGKCNNPDPTKGAWGAAGSPM